jgi:CBS domain-containing protein
MPQKIREIMTEQPISLNGESTVQEAARTMRERNIGAVLITDGEQRLQGIVTDRDIVVRAIAQGKEPSQTRLREICSAALAHLTPEDTVDNAIKLMAKKGIRRIPVIDGERPVGVISLGDLALARDRDSALGSISSASPNQ